MSPPAAAVAVCTLDELPPGTRKLVTANGRSIGVFNVDGALYALRNVCPHRGAPLCVGPVSGTMLPSAPDTFEYGLDGRVLRCPWHAWEFDITTGRAFIDPERYSVRTYAVETVDGVVYLWPDQRRPSSPP